MARLEPGLRIRLISALVLAPLALGLVIVGGWAFAGLIALGLALMALEWRGLIRVRIGERMSDAASFGALALAVAALLLAMTGQAGAGLVLLAAGALLAAATAWALGHAAFWTVLGVVYLGVPALALVWLRMLPEAGLVLLVWLLLVVWTTDSAAYFAGRHFRGPLLAPRISPSKTWSGLCGGVIGAGLAGMITAALWGSGRLLQAGGLGAVLAVVAQVGDLAESAMKRKAGVKDAGSLIPGHGGVLDRVDGLVFAAPALALFCLILGPRAWPWS